MDGFSLRNQRLSAKICVQKLSWNYLEGAQMTYTNTGAVRIRRSRGFAMGYFIGGLICILISFVFLAQAIVFPFTVLVLSGLLVLIIGLLNSRDRSVQIIIDEQGIAIKKVGKIEWKHIGSVRRESWPRGLEIIVLELDYPDKSRIQLQVQGLELASSTIFELISLHMHKAESSSSQF